MTLSGSKFFCDWIIPTMVPHAHGLLFPWRVCLPSYPSPWLWSKPSLAEPGPASQTVCMLLWRGVDLQFATVALVVCWSVTLADTKLDEVSLLANKDRVFLSSPGSRPQCPLRRLVSGASQPWRLRGAASLSPLSFDAHIIINCNIFLSDRWPSLVLLHLPPCRPSNPWLWGDKQLWDQFLSGCMLTWRLTAVPPEFICCCCCFSFRTSGSNCAQEDRSEQRDV